MVWTGYLPQAGLYRQPRDNGLCARTRGARHPCLGGLVDRIRRVTEPTESTERALQGLSVGSVANKSGSAAPDNP